MFSLPKDAASHIHPSIVSAINTYGFEDTAKTIMAEAMALFVAAHLYGQADVQEEFDSQLHILGKLSSKLSDINCDPGKSVSDKVQEIHEEAIKITGLRSEGLDLMEIVRIRKNTEITKSMGIILEDAANDLLGGKNPSQIDEEDLEKIRERVSDQIKKRLEQMGMSKDDVQFPQDDDREDWGNPMGDCL